MSDCWYWIDNAMLPQLPIKGISHHLDADPIYLPCVWAEGESWG